jgi:peptidoglycan hydrolase CwlO-like protein
MAGAEHKPALDPVSGRTQPLMAKAAQSIVATTGLEETIVDVLHGRALRHHREGLRQYLAIRLGSTERARDAMKELRGLVAATSASELASPPGVRARVYGYARQVAKHLAEQQPPEEADAKLPWHRPPEGSGVDPDVVRALRTQLGEADAEILELHHARELQTEELAHVLGVSAEQVEQWLSEASKRAEAELAGARGTDVGRVLLEAFALQPETPQQQPPEQDPAEPDQHPPLPEGTVIGQRYEIAGRVGTGAFGDVYRAQDTEVPGHVVALKLLHRASQGDEAKRTALRELHLIASVFHPSIVQFKDHGWHEGRLWFVMPWYEGETLEARLTRRPLGRAEARRIFEPLARALATMHEAGIRHQDIKPDNIFLARIRGFVREEDDEEMLPVLIDLGVAAKEAEMVVAGTPEYLAPEVAAQFVFPGEHPPTTPAADVFSLSLALRNALEPETQEEVAGGAVEAFVTRRAQQQPPLPGSRELRFLAPHFRRWMSTDPADRPTADELAEELQVLTRPEERRRRVVSLARWLGPLLIAVAAVFGSVVWVLNARAEREQREAQRARMTASDLREDLRMTREQRERLEKDVSAIRDRYQKSKMSRKDLTDELAQTEGELKVVRRRYAASEQRRGELTDELEKTRGELEQRSQELASLQGDYESLQGELKSSENRVAELQSELSSTEAELESRKSELEKTQARNSELSGQLERRKQTLAQVRAKRDELQGKLAQARSEQQQLESKLKAREQKIDQLQARIATMKKKLAQRGSGSSASGESDSGESGAGQDGSGSEGSETPSDSSEGAG